MKKIIKFIKNNILGFLVGISLCLNGVIIAENMLSSEQVSYSGSKTEQTTVKGTLDQLFDAVDINERLGSTDISSIGDGTITGAISNVNNTVSDLNSNVSSIRYNTFKNGIVFANATKVVAVRDRDITNTATIDRVEIVGSTDSGNPEMHIAEMNADDSIKSMTQMIFDGTNFIFGGIKNDGAAVYKSLGTMVTFPNYGNKLQSITQNGTYTPTQNCWLVGVVGATAATATIYVNGSLVAYSTANNGSARDYVSVFIPIMAGSTISVTGLFVDLALFGMY